MAKRLKSSEEIDAIVAKMSEDQRHHFRMLIDELLNCYVKADTHGLLLMSADSEDVITFIAVNANDMEAAELLGYADDMLHFRILDKAPPKEMMN